MTPNLDPKRRRRGEFDWRRNRLPWLLAAASLEVRHWIRIVAALRLTAPPFPSPLGQALARIGDAPAPQALPGQVAGRARRVPAVSRR